MHVGRAAQHVYLAGKLGIIFPCVIGAGPVNTNADVAKFAISMLAPPFNKGFIIGQIVAYLPIQLRRYIIYPAFF